MGPEGSCSIPPKSKRLQNKPVIYVRAEKKLRHSVSVLNTPVLRTPALHGLHGRYVTPLFYSILHFLFISKILLTRNAGLVIKGDQV